ncbi:MAG: diguanylate cyclase, partial [Spirochaetales bacterium]|nr:diguanylate cyclase [Spirochaetales bacterium]
SIIAEKIISALSEPLKFGFGKMRLGASIGISIYPNDGDDIDMLLEHADQALYAAKAEGKGVFRYYSSSF